MFYSDLHCDTFYECFVHGKNFKNGDLHITLDALGQFAPCIQTFAHYIPDGTKDKFGFFMRMAEHSMKIIDKCDGLVLYKTPSDIDTAEKEGRVLAVLSVEGGDFFSDNRAENLSRVSFLERNHIKFISLCYNNGSNCCSGAHCKTDGGLTRLGRSVAGMLSEHGIATDVSHLGHKSTMDVLNSGCKALATHSNCFSLCSNARNIRDEAICKLIENDSLLGINLYAPFLNDSGSAVKSDVLRHTDHIRSLGGERILALGADFDGCEALPDGVDSVSDVKSLDIPAELFYNNVKRFLKSI